MSFTVGVRLEHVLKMLEWLILYKNACFNNFSEMDSNERGWKLQDGSQTCLILA